MGHHLRRLQRWHARDAAVSIPGSIMGFRDGNVGRGHQNLWQGGDGHGYFALFFLGHAAHTRAYASWNGVGH